MIDPTIFIDNSRRSRKDGKKRPREGLATDIAKRY